MSARLTMHEIAAVVRELRREVVRAEHPQHLRLLALRGVEAIESLARQVADLTQAAELEERAFEVSLVSGGRRVTEETIRASADAMGVPVYEPLGKVASAVRQLTAREKHREWVIEAMMRVGHTRKKAEALYERRVAQGWYPAIVRLDEGARRGNFEERLAVLVDEGKALEEAWIKGERAKAEGSGAGQ